MNETQRAALKSEIAYREQSLKSIEKDAEQTRATLADLEAAALNLRDLIELLKAGL